MGRDYGLGPGLVAGQKQRIGNRRRYPFYQGSGAFNVTPHRYIHAIFTERGVAKAPYTESLKALATAPAPAKVFRPHLVCDLAAFCEVVRTPPDIAALLWSFTSHLPGARLQPGPYDPRIHPKVV